MPVFTLSSEIGIPPGEFWERMSMAAVNAELWPLVRMTCPPAWRQRPLGLWGTGQVQFRSVILLFGVLPVDVHAFRLERMVPGHGFLERSRSWANRLWQHERVTVATATGCVVTDSLCVEGRLPLITTILMPVYRLVFRHRHERLKALYGRAGN